MPQGPFTKIYPTPKLKKRGPPKRKCIILIHPNKQCINSQWWLFILSTLISESRWMNYSCLYGEALSCSNRIFTYTYVPKYTLFFKLLQNLKPKSRKSERKILPGIAGSFSEGSDLTETGASSRVWDPGGMVNNPNGALPWL
jgi:hypothetical protein